MTYLEVEGASLYYETVGSGPMLLCISGADGSCEIWKGFAECLKDHFTVVMWDRRGFSRSYLSLTAQDYNNRLSTDADDAAALIKHLSPQEPATVIGNSSGAIVSLRLLGRHPDIIRTLISYEPPAAGLLPDFDDLRAKHEEVYNIYRQWGMPPALGKFTEVTKAGSAPGTVNILKAIDFKMPYVFSNTLYWFEREFKYYPLTEWNVDADFRPYKEKLVLVNGELTDHEPYQYRANAALAEKLGLKLEHFPGEHVGHATHALQFSQALLQTLKAKDSYYSLV